MRLPDFTIEHLKRLPLRAIVAFAARCARRVEPLAQRPDGDPEREGRRAAIEAALQMAEDFAAGSRAAPDASVLAAIDAVGTAPVGPLGSRSAAAAAAGAAHAAATAWHALEFGTAGPDRSLQEGTAGDRHVIGALEHEMVDLSALDAFTAAVEAYDAVGYYNETFVAAALKDYDTLLRLDLGRYPELGEPVDPSSGGALGPL
jgi:hypothetical protein